MKTAKELRAAAWAALRGGPYWTYVAGYLLLMLTFTAMFIPLLLLLNRCFGFSGMLWAQPLTEAVMMAVSLLLLTGFIRRISEPADITNQNIL